MVSPILPVKPPSTGPSIPVAGKKTVSPFKKVDLTSIAPIPVRIPEIDHGLAAHILGGAHIEESSLEKIDLEGFSQLRLLAYVKSFLDSFSKTNKWQTNPQVKKVLIELDQALDLAARLNGLKEQLEGESWETRARSFAEYTVQQLQALPKGETRLFPGGWKGVGRPGHAMLYSVTKEQDGRFRFEVYNTGAGLSFHPQAVSDVQTLYGQRFSLVVDADKLCNPLFWQSYYELCQEPTKKGYSVEAEQVYRWLDMLEDSFVEKAQISTLSQKDLELRRPQRAGTCAFESLLAYLKPQLAAIQIDGLSSVYHECKLGLQLHTLELYWQQIEKRGFFSKTMTAAQAKQALPILKLLGKELHTVQSSLLKNVRKGRKTPEAIQQIKKELLAKQQLVKAAKKECHRILSEPSLPTVVQPASVVALHIPDVSIAPIQQLKLCAFDKEEDFFPSNMTVKIFKQVLTEKIATSFRKILKMPEVDDPFWDTHGKEVLPILLEWVRKNTNSAKELSCPSVAIKLLAIFVKLAKDSDDPILSKIRLDQRFITQSMPSIDTPVRVALNAWEAASLQKHTLFLLTNTQKSGLYQEFFCKKDLTIDLNTRETDPCSLVNILRESLTTNPQLYKSLQDKLPKGATDADLLKEYFTHLPPSLQDMQHFLLTFRGAYYGCATKHEKYGCWLPDTENANVLHLAGWQRPSVTNKTDYRKQDGEGWFYNSQQRITTHITELEVRSPSEVGSIKKTKTALDLQLQLIQSSDDPSLRISNLLQFFSSHAELLRKEEYKYFFFSVLFHVSLDGKIPLVDYLKTNSDGIQLIRDFVTNSCKKNEEFPTALLFLLNVGVSCSEYARIFFFSIGSLF